MKKYYKLGGLLFNGSISQERAIEHCLSEFPKLLEAIKATTLEVARDCSQEVSDKLWDAFKSATDLSYLKTESASNTEVSP